MPCSAESAGSSPRARGALCQSTAQRQHQGIIPACAGSTATPTRWRPGGRDHPRVRGEHNRRRWEMVMAWGSSPRARGAHRHGPADHPGGGIIPACAGSTPTSSSVYGGRRDHPRVRGEHLACQQNRSWMRGSSPRARGALLQVGSRVAQAGIIPACAGSTVMERLRQKSDRGSSPRARGALDCQSKCMTMPGIIPACAGSTPWPAQRA